MASLKRKSSGPDRGIVFDSLDDDDNNKGAQSNLTGESSPPTIKLKGSSTTEGGDGEVTLLKTGKKRLKVDASRLMGVDGVRRVYEEFPIICKFNGRGTEVQGGFNMTDTNANADTDTDADA